MFYVLLCFSDGSCFTGVLVKYWEREEFLNDFTRTVL